VPVFDDGKIKEGAAAPSYFFNYSANVQILFKKAIAAKQVIHAGRWVETHLYNMGEPTVLSKQEA